MVNDKRAETIRRNIETSTILSDKEKSDWLNLLELMNDKQFGELEEILASEFAQGEEQPAQTINTGKAIQPSQMSQQQASPIKNMPPLSHIANVPTDVDMVHSVPPPPPKPEPKPVVPQTAPQMSQPPKPLEVKPLSIRPTPSPTLSAFPPTPNYQRPASVQAPKPAQQPAPIPKIKEQSVAVPPAPPVPPVTKPQSNIPFVIQQVEDLQRMSLDSIRIHSSQSIFDVFKKAIEEYGYFTVLQLVEASPLYIEYVNSGKERLNGNESSLTQAELEFMTDLLRNMRFNRW